METTDIARELGSISATLKHIHERMDAHDRREKEMEASLTDLQHRLSWSKGAAAAAFALATALGAIAGKVFTLLTMGVR